MKLIGKALSGKVAAVAVVGALGAGIIGGAVVNASSAGTGVALFAQGGPADGIKKVLDGLVSKNVISQSQEDAIVSALAAARPSARPGGPGFPGVPGFRPGPGIANIRGFGASNDATKYLGLTQQELFAQLKSGKSLGEVAAATAGKSRDGLIAALTAARNAGIDKAVADGKLSAADAATAKAKVAAGVAAEVDRKLPTGPFPGRPGAPRPSASPKTV